MNTIAAWLQAGDQIDARLIRSALRSDVRVGVGHQDFSTNDHSLELVCDHAGYSRGLNLAGTRRTQDQNDSQQKEGPISLSQEATQPSLALLPKVDWNHPDPPLLRLQTKTGRNFAEPNKIL